MNKHIELTTTNNVNSIGKTGGIYLFYGSDGELLYLGKAGDLRTRVVQHLNGKSNTVDICKFFDSVGVIYIDDRVYRDVLETMLINLWKPKLNVDKAWTYDTEKWEYLSNDKDYIEKCRPAEEAMNAVLLAYNL